MTAAQAPRRSEKALAALAAGRARRKANLEERREQAESQPDSQAISPTPSERAEETPPALPSETPSPSSQPPSLSASRYANGGSRSNADADELHILFDDAPVDDKPARRASKPTVKRAAPPAPKPPASSPKAQGGAAKAPPWVDEREERVRYHADQDAPTLGRMLISAASLLMDKAAAPSQDLADDMARPALRLLYRNFPTLMEMSPNAKDAGELIMAVTIWTTEVTEYRKTISRGERRVQRAPINFPPSRSAYPAGNGATANGGYAGQPVASNGSGGQPAYEAGNSAADSGQGQWDTRGATAGETQVFQDLGISF